MRRCFIDFNGTYSTYATGGIPPTERSLVCARPFEVYETMQAHEI